MHPPRTIPNLLIRGTKAVWGRITALDEAVKKHYRPRYLAILVLVIIGTLMSFMLFTPPYLGLSNDGSFDNVLVDAGLERTDPAKKQAYFNYYERIYQLKSDQLDTKTTPAFLRVVIQIAKAIDTFFTRDLLFDVRFLALIYIVMYLSVLSPLVCMLLRRVQTYSKGIIIAVFFVVIFADVSIATRFASLYTQPLELILLLAIADMLILTARHTGHGPYPFLLFMAVTLLMQINAYCALAGIMFSLVYWRLTSLSIDSGRRIVFGLCALGMCIISVTAVAKLEATRTKAQKYDQMTRGVLFQSKNPEDTLAEFGIEPRYSILTDTYAEQVFPVVLPGTRVLDEGFFGKYDIGEVLVHYVRHPNAIMGLFDIGVHRSFLTRSDYSGNFEESVGMPARAKSMFMSLWSTFKTRTAPKTVSFFALLILILNILYTRRAKKREKESDETNQNRLTYSLISALAVFAAVELITVVVHSGDSELIRESYLMGACIDLLIILFLSEILNRLKIVQSEV